jgi:hypothetical protein
VQAVKDRLASRSRSPVFAESAPAPSFAEKLKEVVGKRSPAKRHKEGAERERERYEQQRKRAIGE